MSFIKLAYGGKLDRAANVDEKRIRI